MLRSTRSVALACVVLVACFATAYAAVGDAVLQSTMDAGGDPITLAQSSTDRGIVARGDYIYFCKGGDVWRTTTLTGLSEAFSTAVEITACRALVIDQAGTYMYVNTGVTVVRVTMATPATVVPMTTGGDADPFDETVAGGLPPDLIGLAIDGVDTLYVFNNEADPLNNNYFKREATSAGIAGAWTVVDDGLTGPVVADSIAVNSYAGEPATHIIRFSLDSPGSSAVWLNSLASNAVTGADYAPLNTLTTGEILDVALVSASDTTMELRLVGAASLFSVTVGSLMTTPTFAVTTAAVSVAGALPAISLAWYEQYQSLVAVGSAANSIFHIVASNTVTASVELERTVLNNGGATVVLFARLDRAVQFDTTFAISPASGDISGTPVTIAAGDREFRFQYKPPTFDTSAATPAITFTQSTNPFVALTSAPTITLRPGGGNNGGALQRIDAINNANTYAGATGIVGSADATAVFITQGMAVRKVTMANVASEHCAAGTNTDALVGIISDSTYIYVYTISKVFRCPIGGGSPLEEYGTTGTPYDDLGDITAIAVSAQTSPVVFVAKGANIYAIVDDERSGAMLDGNAVIDLDAVTSIAVMPEGNVLFFGATIDGDASTLFRADFAAETSLLDFTGLLSSSNTVAQDGSGTTTTITQLLSQSPDGLTNTDASVYIVTATAVREFFINYAPSANPPTVVAYADTNLEYELGLRAGRTFVAITTDSNTDIVHLERVSVEDSVVSLDELVPLYPYPSDNVIAGQPTVFRALLTGSLVESFAATISCTNGVVATPAITIPVGATFFTFEVTPTAAGNLDCTFDPSTVVSGDLVRFNVPTNFVDLSVSAKGTVVFSYPASTYTGATYIVSFTNSLAAVAGGAYVALTCTGTGVTITPEKACLSSGSGSFTLIGGSNTGTCTGTISGPQASNYNSVTTSPSITVTPRVSLTQPRTSSIANPNTVYAGQEVGVTFSHTVGSNVAGVSVASDCHPRSSFAPMPTTWSIPAVSGSTVTEPIILLETAPIGLARCSFIISSDNGRFLPVPDLHFIVSSKFDIALTKPADTVAAASSFVITVTNPVNDNFFGPLELDFDCTASGAGTNVNKALTVTGTGVTEQGTDEYLVYAAGVSGTGVYTFTTDAPDADIGVLVKCSVSRFDGLGAVYYTEPADFEFWSGTKASLIITDATTTPLFAGSTVMTTYFGHVVTVATPGTVEIDTDLTVNLLKNGVQVDSRSLIAGTPLNFYLTASSIPGDDVWSWTLTGTDRRHFNVPASITKTTEARDTFTVTGLPAAIIAGSTTESSVTTVTVSHPDLLTSETAALTLSCANTDGGANTYVVAGPVGGTNGAAAATNVVTFSTTGTANADGTFVITVPAIAADGSAHVFCTWSLPTSELNSHFIVPAPFSYFIGTQVQMTRTLVTAGTDSIIVGATTQIKISAPSGVVADSPSNNRALQVDIECAPCDAANTGSADPAPSSATFTELATFPTAADVNGLVTFTGITAGTVRCDFFLDPEFYDATHFLAPPSITFTVLPKKTFTVTANNGLPATIPASTVSVVNYPGIVVRQDGASSTFTLGVTAPMLAVSLELECTGAASVVASGGSSAATDTVTWTAASSTAGSFLVTVTNAAVVGNVVYCSWTVAGDDTVKIVAPQDFTFQIATATVQLVATGTPTIMDLTESKTITLSTNPVVATGAGAAGTLACVNAAGSTTFSPSFTIAASQASVGGTVTLSSPSLSGIFTCTYMLTSSTTSEYRRYLVPEPFSLTIRDPIKLTFSGAAVSTTVDVINNVPSGAPTVVTLTAVGTFAAGDSVSGTLVCTRGDESSLRLDITPSASFTFVNSGTVQFSLPAPEIETTRSATNQKIECSVTNYVRSSDTRIASSPAGFEYTIGDAIELSFASKPTMYAQGDDTSLYYTLAIPICFGDTGRITGFRTSCPTNGGELQFNDVDDGWQSGTITTDYSSPNDIPARYYPGTLTGTVACEIQIISDYQFFTFSAASSSFTVLPRKTFTITDLPATLAVGATAEIFVAPATAAGVGGVVVDLSFVGGLTFDRSVLFFEEGITTAQAVVVTNLASIGASMSVIASGRVGSEGLTDAWVSASASTSNPASRTGSTTHNGESKLCTYDGIVDVTLTISAAPSSDLSAELNCWSGLDKQTQKGGTPSVSYEKNSPVTAIAQYSPLFTGGPGTGFGLVWCEWTLTGADAPMYTIPGFWLQVGTPKVITVTGFPVAMLPSTTATFTVSIPASNDQVNVFLTITGDATVSQSSFGTFQAASTQTITITSGTVAGPVVVAFSRQGAAAYEFGLIPSKTFVLLPPTAFSLALPPSNVYTGTAISVGVTPGVAPPLDFTVAATCDKATLSPTSLTFVAGSTTQQFFSATPTAAIVPGSGPQAVTCTFEVTGPGAAYVQEMPPQTFAITVPATQTSTGSSNTGGTGGNTGNGRTSTGGSDDDDDDSSAMTAASLPSMALYAILLLAARWIVRA